MRTMIAQAGWAVVAVALGVGLAGGGVWAQGTGTMKPDPMKKDEMKEGTSKGDMKHGQMKDEMKSGEMKGETKKGDMMKGDVKGDGMEKKK